MKHTCPHCEDHGGRDVERASDLPPKCRAHHDPEATREPKSMILVCDACATKWDRLVRSGKFAAPRLGDPCGWSLCVGTLVELSKSDAGPTERDQLLAEIARLKDELDDAEAIQAERVRLHNITISERDETLGRRTSDNTWQAIYAAEFVRRVADAARFNQMDDEMIDREREEAKALADWHQERTKGTKS